MAPPIEPGTFMLPWEMELSAESPPPPIRIDPEIPFGPSLMENPIAIESLTAVVEATDDPTPGYLSPVATLFGTRLTRICGDYGETINNIGIVNGVVKGRWGKVSRHHYSKDQPWNDDESLLWIMQDGAYPSKMILDARSYLPIIGNRETSNNSALLDSSYEFRWRPGHPTEAVSWVKSNKTVVHWDVLEERVIWQANVPSLGSDASDRTGDFGMLGEGVVSTGGGSDGGGRYVVLCSAWLNPNLTNHVDHFYVIDLEEHIVGPINYIPMPLSTTKYGEIGWCSISPLGTYVIVKYKTAKEYHRCFDIDPVTLVATPHVFSELDHPLRMDDARPLLDGWMATLSHADFQMTTSLTLTPPASSAEVLIGGLRHTDAAVYCNDTEKKERGHVIAQSMTTGKHLHVSRGTTALTLRAAEDQHTSGRCYQIPGFGLVTHARDDRVGYTLSDEVILYELLNLGRAIRCGTTHTNDNALLPPTDPDYDPLAGGYRAEAHGCPSPSASKVIFASNWQMDASSAGAPDIIKSYVLDVDSEMEAVGYVPIVHDEPEAT